MNLLLGIIISSIIGSLIFILLLMLQPVTWKIFSRSWHYYILLIPIFLLLGGTHIGISVAGLIPYPTTESQAYVEHSSAIHGQIGLSPEDDRGSSGDYITIDEGFASGIAMDNEASEYGNAFSLINGELIIGGFEAVAPFLLGFWVMGVFIYLGMNKVVYLKYRRAMLKNCKIVTTIKAKSSFMNYKIPVMASKDIDTPMLIGIVKPIIALPDLHLFDEEVEMILEHELTHYRRKDLIVKLAMLVANGIHWFNPLVYVLSKQLNIMCELSCDEKVVLKMDNLERRFYGETILYVLENSTGKKGLNCNVAFATSQNDSKERIRGRLMNVQKAKKMKALTVAIAILSGILIIGCSAVVAGALNGVLPVDEEIGTTETSAESIETNETDVTPMSTEEASDRSEYHIVVNGVGLPLIYEFFILDGETMPTHVPLHPVLTALGWSDISAGSQIAVQNEDDDIIAQLNIVNYLAFDEGEIDMSAVGLSDVFMAQNFGIYAPLSFFLEMGFTAYYFNGQVFIDGSEGAPEPLSITSAEIFPELAYDINDMTREHIPADIGNTFIQVDLTNQYLWYFIEGELILEGSVVTGRPEYPTPTGVFEVLWTESPTVLRGPIDSERGGYEWEVEISYWMGITWCGVGLHDAVWQPYFGGDRFTYSGSRGCIEMPLDMISELFNMVPEGTPVVVHY